MKEKNGKYSPFDKFKLSVKQQCFILFCNYIPFFITIFFIMLIFIPWTQIYIRIITAIIYLFLFPPIIARIMLKIFPIRNKKIPIPSRDYFVWWFILSLQIIFCRITFLEEFLRIIPGAYGVWLRLWGARIGGFIYWGAGLRILDRSFLDIGLGVSFGAGVRLNSHVITKNNEGEMELLLDDITIGSGSIIGGYSLLTAGTVLEENEITRAFTISPPFSHWKNGKRINRECSKEL